MKAWLAKVRRGDRIGLIPTDDAGRTLLERMGDGECAEFSIVRPRSLPMHRRLFGIARSIGENQDPPRDEKSIVDELKVRAGHFEVFWVDGNEVRVPKSIAFDRLTHDEWMQIWPSLEQAGIERFGIEYWLEEAIA